MDLVSLGIRDKRPKLSVKDAPRAVGRTNSLDALRKRLSRPDPDSGSESASIPPSPPASDFGGGVGIGSVDADKAVQFLALSTSHVPRERELSMSSTVKELSMYSAVNKHLKVLQRTMPPVATSSIQQLAEALLKEPRTLYKAFHHFFYENHGMASRDDLEIFIHQVKV